MYSGEQKPHKHEKLVSPGRIAKQTGYARFPCRRIVVIVVQDGLPSPPPGLVGQEPRPQAALQVVGLRQRPRQQRAPLGLGGRADFRHPPVQVGGAGGPGRGQRQLLAPSAAAARGPGPALRARREGRVRGVAGRAGVTLRGPVAGTRRTPPGRALRRRHARGALGRQSVCCSLR